MENLYRNTARFYDLRSQVKSFPDVPFYLERAEKAGGAVLELAAGTGRVSLPLAEAGCEVWALDLSEDMLAELKRKSLALPEPARKRIHIVHADMCDFRLHRRFRLIILPFHSIHVIPEADRRAACLACVRDHLESNGRFIISFVLFSVVSETGPVGRTIEVMVDPETGNEVAFEVVTRNVDPERRVFEVDHIFTVRGAKDHREQRLVTTLRQTWFNEEQMRETLTGNGFEILEEYGGYDGRAPEKGIERVLVCRAGER